MNRIFGNVVYGMGLLGVVALSGCAANASSGDGADAVQQSGEAVTAAAASESLDTAPVPAAAASGSAFILGAIKDTAGLPVPGVAVNITGAASHSAVTNSNGVYFFGSLPNGTYNVKPSKSGGAFQFAPPTGTSTATSTNVTAGSAGVQAEFLCKSGCDGAATVDKFRELTIVNPAVVNDARASGAGATAGPWSFRFLMEQMAPTGTDPAVFTLNWLQGFESTAGPVNGFPVENRLIKTGLIDTWPKLADGRLDLKKAPFQLLAIVNRTDLHVVGAGEARFVFGMVTTDAAGKVTSGLPFTVIFEYRLPVTDATGATILRKQWVSDFHALGTVGFGPTYNTRLQSITDRFTRRGTTAANPNGNSISQVRTNEIQFSPNGIWQLREFHLVADSTGKGFLKLSQTAQTPDNTKNGDTALGTFINNNKLKMNHGLQPLSSTFIGGQSDEDFSWSFPNVDASTNTTHLFAGQTCNGCHSGETAQIDGFYQITPERLPLASGSDGTIVLSSFVVDVELPRRTRFMQNRLVCSSSADCSPGAEAFTF